MSVAARAKAKRAELLRLSQAARKDALVGLLRETAAAALRVDPNVIAVDAVNPDPMPMFEFFEERLLSIIGTPLRWYDLPHCHSIGALAEHLAKELAPPPAPADPMRDLYEDGAMPSGLSSRQFGAKLERPIVFLLSAARSGSTLLCNMLGKHPQLYAASELCLLSFDTMGARRRQIEATGQKWMRLGLCVALHELAGMTEDQALRRSVELENRDVPVSVVYAGLQTLAKDRMVIDKSPTYAGHPDWLAHAERLFRSARYIHLIRDPGAVIESLVRMRFHRWRPGGAAPEPNPWIFAERVWASANLHILNFLRGVDPARWTRVSYETLVAEPATVMNQICAFLEIPFDAAVLQPYAGGGANGVGDPGFRAHSRIEPDLALEWRQTPPPHAYGRITREIAAALGYAA